MSDQRIGTCTVCLTAASLPYAVAGADAPPGTADGGPERCSGRPSTRGPFSRG